MRCAALTILLVACPVPGALAADVNAEAPGHRPAAALSYDWSGFYGGPKTGGAWGHATSSQQAGGPPAFPSATAFNLHQPALTPSAFAGSLQYGHNWLRGQWLVGFEADVNYLGLTSSTNFGASLVPGTAVATIRPRVGIVSDRWMLYGTGGFALATAQLGDSVAANGIVALNPQASQTRVGWTLGAGTEWMVVPNLTTRVEYLYVDLGKTDGTPSTGGVGGVASPQTSFGSRLADNIIRFGLNYKFNK